VHSTKRHLIDNGTEVPLIGVVAKRKPTYSFSLYRSSDKTKSFWRWEVYDASSKVICDAGFLYGSRQDAMTVASNSIDRLHQLDQNKSKSVKRKTVTRS
jgi:hypothetical protein